MRCAFINVNFTNRTMRLQRYVGCADLPNRRSGAHQFKCGTLTTPKAKRWRIVPIRPNPFTHAWQEVLQIPGSEMFLVTPAGFVQPAYRRTVHSVIPSLISCSWCLYGSSCTWFCVQRAPSASSVSAWAYAWASEWVSPKPALAAVTGSTPCETTNSVKNP
jgi:hypothetical protein